jgi:glycosyltransferase involved in cell wall biosynthesis
MTPNENMAKSTNDVAGLVTVLSTEPLILIIRATSVQKKVGLAQALGQRLSERPITFLIPLGWHCDAAGAAGNAADARSFKDSCPRHELIFLGDTPEDVDRLVAAGASAFFASGNIFDSENVLCPLPGTDAEFDAVYNARPVPWKRHWLATEIERVAYICHVAPGEEAAAPAVLAAILARGSGHVLINPIVEGLPKSIGRPAVNEVLARCAVGLCLSEVEGAMHASIEYLLAGLPIVSTPSLGGRDVFFDPDYCIIAEPEPQTIRQAVEVLRDRKIPRSYVRDRTLAKLAIERNRFVAFIEGIKARHGISRSYIMEWHLSGLPIQTGTVEEHEKRLLGLVGAAPRADQDDPISGHAALISADPLIVSTPTWPGPLGLAEALGRRCADRDAIFLLPLHWHCDDAAAGQKAAAMRRHRERFPRHRLIVLANTPAEAARLAAAGAEVFLANHNMFGADPVFRPLADVAVEFDAVYNARPAAGKRHELAAEIERVIYLAYVSAGQEGIHPPEILAGILNRGPGHVLANSIVDGRPRWMSQDIVNRTLARAAVGLCLSAIEGAMYSSIEYLLAGLPIVSTPSVGGRDFFFDPDYCVIVEPTPRAVRTGVEAMRARNIPRSYIRERTLAKLAVERHRFLAFVEDIKAGYGVARSFGMEWTFVASPFHNWRTVEEHAADFFNAG